MLSASAGSSFSELSDDQLVTLARGKSEDAFACLLSRYSALLHRLSVQYSGVSSLEAEDLAQEGMLGLLSAVQAYHPGNEAAFGTFACACMRNRMLSAVRCAQGTPLLLDDPDKPPVAEAAAATDDPELLLVRREELESLRAHLHATLTDLEYRVLMRYLGSYSYEEIAQALHISRKTVDNALQRLRRKLSVSFS